MDITEIDNSLKEAVNYRFVSDVPFSFLLSGGVDSSLVAAISSSLKKETNIESHYLGYMKKKRFLKNMQFLFQKK